MFRLIFISCYLATVQFSNIDAIPFGDALLCELFCPDDYRFFCFLCEDDDEWMGDNTTTTSTTTTTTTTTTMPTPVPPTTTKMIPPSKPTMQPGSDNRMGEQSVTGMLGNGTTSQNGMGGNMTTNGTMETNPQSKAVL